MTMATMKKGILICAPQWWKHLRDWKRVFWRKHRKVEKQFTRQETRTEPKDQP